MRDYPPGVLPDWPGRGEAEMNEFLLQIWLHQSPLRRLWWEHEIWPGRGEAENELNTSHRFGCIRVPFGRLWWEHEIDLEEERFEDELNTSYRFGCTRVPFGRLWWEHESSSGDSGENMSPLRETLVRTRNSFQLESPKGTLAKLKLNWIPLTDRTELNRWSVFKSVRSVRDKRKSLPNKCLLQHQQQFPFPTPRCNSSYRRLYNFGERCCPIFLTSSYPW